MMKITMISLMIFGTCLATNAYAERQITLPHTEDFSASNSISDIRWVTASTGGNVTRVQSSWRGSGDYCVRIDPPNIQEGNNGQYAALGSFLFSPTPILTVAFALNVGTTYSSSAANIGGGLINKFLDTFNGGTRTGLLGLNTWGSCGGHELGVMTATVDYIYYNNQSPNCNSMHFGDGVGTNDYGGKWIWISYTLNTGGNEVYLRIWDRLGNFSGTYIYGTSTRSNGTTTELKTLGGYYNELHPTRDTNSRLLIDDLIISNTPTAISPPPGFITSGGSDISAPNGVRVLVIGQ